MPMIQSIRSLVLRIRNLFREARLERDRDAELTAHIDLHIADNLRGAWP